MSEEDSVALIPIEIDALPAPIRIVKEAQKKYLTLEIYLRNIVNTYNETGVMSRDFFKIIKEQREWAKLMGDLTKETQNKFDQIAGDVLIQIARERPELRKALGEQAAREFLKERGKIMDVVVDDTA